MRTIKRLIVAHDVLETVGVVPACGGADDGGWWLAMLREAGVPVYVVPDLRPGDIFAEMVDGRVIRVGLAKP